MAKLNTPKGKLVRKLGVNIFGNPKFDKLLSRKGYRPGQHGQSRKRFTTYSTQLKEKQKIKFMYGMLEKQFRNYFKKASQMKGETGLNLLVLLESRLDNVVYKLGFAPSRPSARQLVNHAHFMVNGKRVNIPSYRLKPGDTIQVRDKSKKLDIILDSIKMIKGDLNVSNIIIRATNEMANTIKKEKILIILKSDFLTLSALVFLFLIRVLRLKEPLLGLEFHYS